MNTHVPLGLWIAVPVGVAFCYLVLAAALRGRSPGGARRRALAVLTAWPAAFTALAAAGAFAATYHQAVPLIAFGIVVPIVAGVAWFARSGSLRGLLARIPLSELIGIQMYRVIGGLFILAWALGRMPAIFALPAGIGDVLVGVAAPFVAARVGSGDASGASPRARRIAIGWNVAGIVDLIVAVAMGASTSPSSIWSPLLGHGNPLISRLPFVLIPVFLVPVSILLHFAALQRLRAPGWARGRSPVGQRPAVAS